MQLQSITGMVKRLLGFLFLFLLLFNFMGYWVIFEVNRYQIRKEMESSSAGKRPIEVIEISNTDSSSDLRWVNEHEFVYQGNLYDVIYTSPRSSKKVYYCIHDKKEQNLVKAFQHANTSKVTQSLLNLIVHNAMPVLSLSAEFEIPREVIYPHITIQLCQVSIPPGYPPPRCHQG
ncbi:MAG: hypothetical protein IH596_00720 [Bacteroidales bacterium]|nr:hypothetical protein [Bacteroidales bacterium]